MPIASPSSVSAGWRERAQLAGAVLFAALLLESAIETFWRGSPMRWWVAGVLVLSGGFVVLVWRVLGSLGRLVAPLLILLGLIAFSAIKIDSANAEGLFLAGVGLARLEVLLVAAAVALALALLLRPGVLRPLAAKAVVVSVGAWALVPFLVGAWRDLSFSAVLRGEHVWTRPPFWLQGAYVASQVVVPIGLLFAIFLIALAARRRVQASALPACSIPVLLAAFVVVSAELSRAGVPHLTRVLFDPLASISTLGD